jgi:hypothetical protein
MQTTTRTLYLCTDVRSHTQVWGLLFLHTIDQPMCKPNSEVMTAVNRQFLTKTTLNNGYLGSRNDEERSEMRYVV